MASTGRGRKRNLPSDNNANANQGNKKKKQKTGQSNKDSKGEDEYRKRLQLVDISEYYCCVCKGLSAGKILQCPDGCVICDKCYPRTQPCECPICRTVMNPNKPIRCLLAEKTLALRLVKCKYEGCGKEIPFRILKEHERDECEFKPISCKYADLGCEWQGLRQNLQKHVAKCKVDQNKMLQRVREYERQLVAYRNFMRSCTKIHQHSCGISDNNNFFEVVTEEFFLEGYEHLIKVRSQPVNHTHHQISVQIRFAEDVKQLGMNEVVELELGVAIEPHGEDELTLNFMKQLKATISAHQPYSDWINIEPQLTESRHRKVFRCGFDVKIFEYGKMRSLTRSVRS